jgi:uncharacterized protein YchJ
MNVDTGELRRMNDIGEAFEKAFSDISKKEGFTQVPQELEEEAMRELAGKDSVMVDMKKKTPLTAWAKRVRQGRNERCACGSGKKYKYCCGI